jgi:MFS family permease
MPVPPLSPVARRALLANSINALGNGFTLPFLLVYLHTVRGIPLALTGLVVATIGATGLALSPLVGTAIDRFGALRVQLVSLVVCTAGAAGLTLVHTGWQAFAAVAVLGAGQTGAWPAMNALLAGVSTPEQRQRLFAVEFTLINAGIGIGGIGGGVIADVHRPGTFAVLYLVDAGTYLLAGAVLLTLGGAGGPVPTPVDADGNATASGGWGEVLRDRTMRWVCLLFVVVILAGYGQIDAGMPAFATGVAGVSPRVLGFAFAVNTAVIVLGQLLVLKHVEGRRRTRAIAAFGLIIAGAWALFGASGLVGEVPAATLVVASMGVFAVGETLWSPTGNALVNDLAPAHLRGRYNALSALTWQLAMTSGPIISSLLLDAGLAWPYIAGLVTASLAVVALAWLLERRLTPSQNGVFDSGPPGPDATPAPAPPPTAPPDAVLHPATADLLNAATPPPAPAVNGRPAPAVGFVAAPGAGEARPEPVG